LEKKKTIIGFVNVETDPRLEYIMKDDHIYQQQPSREEESPVPNR
jgi:hypothetical protein